MRPPSSHLHPVKTESTNNQRSLAARFLDAPAGLLEKMDDSIAVVTLNLNDAVLRRPAGSAQLFEGLRDIGKFGFAEARDDGHHSAAAATTRNAYDAVVRKALRNFAVAAHPCVLRQAACGSLPKALACTRSS